MTVERPERTEVSSTVRTSQLPAPSWEQAHVQEAPGKVSGGLPSWPIVALFGGFPLWWVLGLLPFISILLAGLMLVLLIRLPAVKLVPGVLPWLAFVSWTLCSVVMIDSSGRLLGYTLRTGQWVAGAVVLVYVVNARRSISMQKLVSLLLVVWGSTVVGGVVAIISPETVLATPAGRLLPASLTANEYVADLFFPSFAQIQEPWGSEEVFVRPAAPFTYANSWGAALALLTPVALSRFASRPSSIARFLILVGLVGSVFPAVASTNRGMFLAIAFSLTYVALRLAIWGHLRALGLLTLAAVVVLGLLVSFGFGEAISQRQTAGDTTEGRSKLYVETLQRTFESPVLGYGAPRPSIASEISVGTQGQVWFVMFSFGFVGLALYLSFLWGATLRSWSVQTVPELWLHAVLATASVMIAYYGLDATMQIVVVAVAGLLLRDRYLVDADPPDHA